MAAPKTNRGNAEVQVDKMERSLLEVLLVDSSSFGSSVASSLDSERCRAVCVNESLTSSGNIREGSALEGDASV